MTRQQFMKELEYLLRNIPESEKADALAYYNDYFDEAGVENEAQVILELGSPRQVAEKILAEYSRDSWCSADAHQRRPSQADSMQQQREAVTKKKTTNKSTKILFILLLICTFPLWIGIVAGLFGVLVAVFASIFGIVVGFGGAGIGLLVGGVACLAAGMIRITIVPIEGLITIAVGSVLIAIGTLLALLVTWMLFKWIPAIIKALVSWVKGLRKPQEGGDEI